MLWWVCSLFWMRTRVSLIIVLQRPRHFESRFQHVVCGGGTGARFSALDGHGHYDLRVVRRGEAHEPAVVIAVAALVGAGLAGYGHAVDGGS